MALYLKDFDKGLQKNLRKLALDKGIPLKKLIENILKKEVQCSDRNTKNDSNR